MELDSKELERMIQIALQEDLGRGDVTTDGLLPKEAKARGHFAAREALVACGLPLMPLVFDALDPMVTCRPLVEEGALCNPGDALMEIAGPARAILTGERVALNLLQRASGVATLTRRYVEVVKHTKAAIRDTRKTMPGMRALDKYAVRVGGAENHRMRLDDGILIKDNHLALMGGDIAEAVKKMRTLKPELPIEVECDTLEQVKQALSAGADVILLDNFELDQTCQAVQLVAGMSKLEASGGITLENLKKIAETGVDYIAIGALTHSARAVDIGLDF